MTGERGRGAGTAAALAGGALLGILLLSAVRFVGQPEEQHVHYHANWAVFVDGQRVDLSANRYMEDVASCSADPSRQRPEDRVHMHESNQDVVHVHDSGATWGHLLANLGFGVGDDYLDLDEKRYADGDGRTLKFVVDGSPVRSIRNRPIMDEDRLLISYGAESAEMVLAEQFPHVAESAAEYNVRPDPASCAGAEEATLGDRIRRAVWF